MANLAAPLRVLVVDADPSVADSLALVFRRHLHEARAVYSAQQAIALAGDFQPHAVISEAALPGMDGTELALHMAAHHPNCRVLLLSAHGAALPLLQRAIDRGCSPTLLPKPVPPRHLLAFVNSCSA